MWSRFIRILIVPISIRSFLAFFSYGPPRAPPTKAERNSLERHRPLKHKASARGIVEELKVCSLCSRDHPLHWSCSMAFPQNFARSSTGRVAKSTLPASHGKKAQVLMSTAFVLKSTRMIRIKASTWRMKSQPSFSPLPRTKRNNLFSKTCFWHIFSIWNSKDTFLRYFFLICEISRRIDLNEWKQN